MWMSVARSRIASRSRSLTSLMTLASGLLDLVGLGGAELRFQRLRLGGQRVERVAGHSVVGADELADVPLVGQDQLDRHACHQAELIEGGQLKGIARGHAERAVGAPDGHAPLLEDELGGEQSQDLFLDLDRVEIDDGQRKLVADHLQHVGALDVPQTDQNMVEPFAGAVLLCDRLVQLLLGDEPALQKYASDAHGVMIVPAAAGGDSPGRGADEGKACGVTVDE